MLDLFYPTSEDDLYIYIVSRNNKINTLVIYREDCKNEILYFFLKDFIWNLRWFLLKDLFVFMF
jgi:hypothetical protein